MRRGLVVSSWNQWVESQGGEGVATLAGVASGILDCYLDGYRYRVCRNAGELAEEVSRRESLLESVQVGKPDSSNDERFRQRVEPTFPIWLNIPLSKSSAFFKPLSICETLAVGMAIITP